MSRKIIGITVGTQLPKPNFNQNDPTKGDYIKNKPDFEGLNTEVNEIHELVGDIKVSTQISNAIANKSDKDHSHDDKYYTESETDALLNDVRTQIGNFVDWFNNGVSIPSGSDINEYTTIGKYYVGSGDIAETLINSPTTSDNYVLYVFKRTSGSSITQMAITLNGALYIRGTNASGSFRAWKRKADNNDLEAINTQLTELINSKSDIGHTHSDYVATDDFDAIQRLVGDTPVASQITSAVANKSDVGHMHDVSNISDLTATAIELNYMGGVTSNIQAQLNTLSNNIDKRIPFNNSGAIEITSESDLDLNNYTTVGIYTAVSSIGKTLLNSPIATGQKLIVIQGYSSDRKHQILFGSATSNIHHRMYNGSDWSTWANLSKTTLEELGVAATAIELNYITGVTSNVQEQLNEKSDKSHEHNDINTEISKLNTLVGDTEVSTQITNAIADKADKGHEHDSAYDIKGASDAALASAKTYADSAVAAVKDDLLSGAGGAYDTLKELGDLIDDNTDAISALETVASNKANAADLTSHTSNKSNPHGVTALQAGAIPINNTGSSSIASNDDLDNYRTVGVYTAAAAVSKTLLNSPIATGLKLIVLAGYSTDRKHQILFGSATSNIFHRMYNGSTWSSWANLSKTTLEDLGITATATELNYVTGVTSNIQTQIDSAIETAKTYADATVMAKVYEKGTSIPSESDLDTYMTVGKYFASSNAIAKSLTNCPTTINFVMYVFARTVNDTPTQMIIDLNGKLYLRSRSSSEWRSWQTYLTESSLTSAIEAALQEAKDSGVFTPVKGVDYWTDSDREQIIQDVVAALGTPVFGTVDENNNIILSGELADGTYTVKYENMDGSVSDIGVISVDPTGVWMDDYRLNTSGYLTYMPYNNAATHYIPCVAGDVVRIQGLNISRYNSDSSGDWGRSVLYYYTADKTPIEPSHVPHDETSIFTFDESSDTWTFTVDDTSSIAYVRASGYYYDDYNKDNVVITVNGEIS